MNHAETQWLHALYLTHAEPLYRLARARLGDPHEAQDLVQAVFLAAGQKAATLQTHPNPLGWLLQALQYELSHTFSKRARRAGREVPLDTLPPGQAAAPGPSLGLAEVLPTQLSPRDREILLLYYEEGLSYQEMADRLGIPLSTCGTRLARAKAHCKTYLTQPPPRGATMPNRRNGHVPPIRRPVSGVGDHVVSRGRLPGPPPGPAGPVGGGRPHRAL